MEGFNSQAFLVELAHVLPSDKHVPLYEKLEHLLRATVLRCLLDESFGNFFKDKAAVEARDLTLLDFRVIQYRRKGNAIATDEQLERIARVPKREFMRRGINQHTLEKICKRVPVRADKLARCLRVLEEYENRAIDSP